MFRKEILVVILFVLVVCPAEAGGLLLNLEHSFTVKGLSGPVRACSFSDLNADGVPEVLARDSLTTVLYSISGDSIITSFSLGPLLVWGTVLADVNRDNKPDIVTAYVSPTIHSSGYVIVSVRDGASGYTVTHTDSLATRFADPLGRSVLLGVFTAVDINDDSYTELLMSVDSTSELLGLNDVTDTEVGFTLCYYTFPDSVLWRKPGFFTRMGQLPAVQNPPVFIGNSYKFTYFFEVPSGPGIDYMKTITTVAGIGQDGPGNDLIDVNHSGDCSIDYQSEELNSLLCSGHLLGDTSQVEILMAYHHEFQGYPLCLWEAFDSLQLYREVNPDSVTLVWSIRISGSPDPCAFVYHPDFPGYYLRFYGGKLRSYEGATATAVDSSDSVPAGSLGWTYPETDRIPRLTAVSGMSVSLYTVDVATDVQDDPRSMSLPADFAIGNPYPNPFNNELSIPFILNRAGQLRVSVFNMLGKEVVVLIDRQVSAGTTYVNWRPTKAASGVYLLRGSMNGTARTIKTVLLK